MSNDTEARAAAKTLAAALARVHFDGNGCGTHGPNACSVCHGPSPMTAQEVAEEVLRSGWLTAHEEKVRAETLAPIEVLADAWDAALNQEFRVKGYTHKNADALRAVIAALRLTAGSGQGDAV